MGQYQRKVKKGVRWFYSGQYLRQKYHSQAIYLSKKECSQAERAKLDEIDEMARNPNQNQDMPIASLFNERLSHLELTRSRFYYEDNKRFAQLMIKEWGNIPASKVTKIMINRLVLKETDRVKKVGLSNHRPNDLIKIAKAFFNYGIKKLDLELKNPCDGIEFLPMDIKMKYIPPDNDFETVRNRLNPRQRLLFDFVDETAARIGEAIKLDYKDVKEDYIVLYTRKSRNSNLTPRIIPRPSIIKPGGKGKVFPEWNEYPRFLDETVRKLKQPIWNWHCLRHRRASLWAKNGLPLIEIMARLGHYNISTTQIYLRLLGFSKV